MSVLGMIAIAAAIAALTGVGAALGMSHATAKAVESIARQPEASGKVNSSLMFGLIMMETTAIYGLFVAILLIFVLPGSIAP
ncbi:MAG: ATP synthase F0 subunit C [Oscillospiraceae bacterium]|nr:ATP synthase F0 subunit C [Oscillospiraceae bacterium]